MAKPIIILKKSIATGFEECSTPRLYDILCKFYDGKVYYNRNDLNNAFKFQIIEHVSCLTRETKIKNVGNKPVVFHHSEGDPKYFANYKQLKKIGTFLHSNFQLKQGRFFAYWMYDYISSIEKYKIEVNQETNFFPKFLCLNGRPDVHRYFVIQQLKDRNLLDFGLVSFLNRYNQIENKHYYKEFKDLYKSETNFVDDIHLGKKLLLLDKTNEEIHSDDRSHAKFLYSSTSISLITETYADNRPGCFITEKSWKPIANLHFPIWVAQRGIVDAFRQMGYDVFDDIIDHSYDKEKKQETRWAKAIHALENTLGKITSLSARKKIDLHNRLEKNKARMLNSKIKEQEVRDWL